MKKTSALNLQLAKDEIEIKKWSDKKRKIRPHFYIFYAMVIFCLAYIVDEIATNINSVLQNDVFLDFFNSDYTLYTITLTLCSSIAIFSFFYRPLADKYGRKPFLIINLFGIAIGMFICFIAPILPIYIIGITILFFFAPCDIQVLYVIETSSDKRRALNLSITKAIGIMGVSVVPMLAAHVEQQGYIWQGAFLAPAIVALLVGIIGILLIQESEVFLDCKISNLEDRIRAAHKRGRKKEIIKNNEGGIIPAIKHMFKNKFFLWLFLAMFVFAISSIGQANYSIILSSKEYSPLSDTAIDNALILYPFVCAAIILISGIISDKFGRRMASILNVSVSLISIIFFIFAVRFNWNCWVIGSFLGLFIGGYLSGLDTMNIMCSEESPTALRSSIMSVISVSISAGSFVATAISILFDNLLNNLDISLLVGIMVPPSLCLALFVLLMKIPETKGKALFENKKRKKGD